MPGTTMIGDCRYHGPSGSVLPPDARQAKRLLKSLKSVKTSARALIAAVHMVDVYLPSEQEADGGTFDPVMAALAASRAKRESGDAPAASTAAAAAFAPPSAHYTDHHKRAIRVATETLRRLLRSTLDSMMAVDANTMEQYDNSKGLIEERMGLALHLAVDRAVDVGMAELAKEDNPGDRDNDGGACDDDNDMQRKRSASDDKKLKKKEKKRRRYNVSSGDVGEDVDDNNSDAASSRGSNPRFDTTSEDRDRTFAFRRTTSLCLESLSLQIVARTTVTWGKKKMYEIYQLPRPLRPVGGKAGVTAVQNAVEKEFRAIFRGGGEDQCGIRVYGLLRKIAGSALEDGIEEEEDEVDAAFGEKSVERQQQERNGHGEETTYLFIHMCIGKPLDLHDENLRAPSGEKRKKKANEFIAVLRPGSALFALSASRAPSGSRFTKFLLGALAKALSSGSGASAERKLLWNLSCHFSLYIYLIVFRVSLIPPSIAAKFTLCAMHTSETLSAERVGDISGTEPLDLLRSASTFVDGAAIGRFSNYTDDGTGFAADMSLNDPFSAGDGGAHNPLVEINQVSTGTLMSRATEESRLETGTVISHHFLVISVKRHAAWIHMYLIHFCFSACLQFYTYSNTRSRPTRPGYIESRNQYCWNEQWCILSHCCEPSRFNCRS